MWSLAVGKAYMVLELAMYTVKHFRRGKSDHRDALQVWCSTSLGTLFRAFYQVEVFLSEASTRLCQSFIRKVW